MLAAALWEDAPQSANRSLRQLAHLDADPAERQILEAVLDGRSVSGMLFGISAHTVEVHRHRINHKLGARNTAELVRLASAVMSGDDRH